MYCKQPPTRKLIGFTSSQESTDPQTSFTNRGICHVHRISVLCCPDTGVRALRSLAADGKTRGRYQQGFLTPSGTWQTIAVLSTPDWPRRSQPLTYLLNQSMVRFQASVAAASL